jgi:hypothetical protein
MREDLAAVILGYSMAAQNAAAVRIRAVPMRCLASNPDRLSPNPAKFLATTGTPQFVELDFGGDQFENAGGATPGRSDVADCAERAAR